MDASLKSKLDDYYRKKGQYNKKLQARKEKIMARKTSISDKRVAIKRIKLPCIFCKRNVKTIFEREFDRLIARCGDIESPCEGKIEITNIVFSLTEQLAHDFELSITLSKQKIQQLKYQTLFSYLSKERSMKEFATLLKEYNEELSVYIGLIRKYTLLTERKEVNDIIEEETLRLERISSSIQFSFDQYRDTGEISFMKEGIDIMVDTLTPILKKIDGIKYAYREIETIKESATNGRDDMHYLISRPYPFEAEESVI